MAKKTSRPGRTLLIFFIAVAVLYGLAALGGTAKPRLGLDLEGGTRITLTAISGASQTKLEQARGIIDQRVNANGVAESDVTVQGNKNVVVEIPGKNSKGLVDAVKRTAQLQEDLVVGDEVILSAGIFGTIVEVDGDRVRLEIADGVVITTARQVVVRRAPDAEPHEEALADQADATPDRSTEED